LLTSVTVDVRYHFILVQCLIPSWKIDFTCKKVIEIDLKPRHALFSDNLVRSIVPPVKRRQTWDVHG